MSKLPPKAPKDVNKLRKPKIVQGAPHPTGKLHEALHHKRPKKKEMEYDGD